MTSLQPMPPNNNTTSAPCTVTNWESVIEDLVPLNTQLVPPALADAFDLPSSRPLGSTQLAVQNASTLAAGAPERTLQASDGSDPYPPLPLEDSLVGLPVVSGAAVSQGRYIQVDML